MTTNREILCTSECGYSWIDLDTAARTLVAGFTVYSGCALEETGETDVLVGHYTTRGAAYEAANDAFCIHHVHEIEAAQGEQLAFWQRWNPFTILRAQ